jgi:ABC-type transporter Mla subunit MlaD
VAARITQVQADITSQATAVNALSRAIESFSSVPTTDQRRELDWAFENVTQTVADVNRLLQRELPALYTDLTKPETGPRRLTPITTPVRRP